MEDEKDGLQADRSAEANIGVDSGENNSLPEAFLTEDELATIPASTPRPEPVRDPLHEERWLSLVQWWEERTKLTLFRPPGKVAHDWIVYAGSGGDESVRDVLASVQEFQWDDLSMEAVFSPPPNLVPEDGNWWRWDEVKPKEIEKRRKQHERLAAAARVVLEMRMPLDLYDSEPDPDHPGSFKLEDLRQVYPDDDACWDELVGSEARDAAILLAKLKNPYPTNEVRGGPGYRKRNQTAALRLVIRSLDELKSRGGRRLRNQELAVLCLLAKPECFSQFPDVIDGDNPPPPFYLKGAKDNEGRSWQWGTGRDTANARSLFQSDGFKRLTNNIIAVYRLPAKRK